MENQGHFEDLLDRLEKDALEMERTGDTAIVHLLFRTAHNLKSSTAQAGFTTLSREVHELEDTLDKIRRGKEQWEPTSFDRVTKVVDLARLSILGNLPPDGPAPVAPPTPRPAALKWGCELSPEQLSGAEQALAEGQGLFRIEKLFRNGLFEEVFLALPVMEDIKELGTLIALNPSWEAYRNGPDEQVVKLLFASPKTSAELAEVLFDPLIVLQEPSAPPGKPGRGPLRFLIVEDDPTAGGLLRYILSQHGDCVLCESGNDGIATFREGLAQARPFDLAVLDLFLPDLHGTAVLKELRACEAGTSLLEAESRCLVLINTASRDLDQMRQSLEMEPDGYLLKPINVDFIMGQIGALKAQRLPAG